MKSDKEKFETDYAKTEYGGRTECNEDEQTIWEHTFRLIEVLGDGITSRKILLSSNPRFSSTAKSPRSFLARSCDCKLKEIILKNKDRKNVETQNINESNGRKNHQYQEGYWNEFREIIKKYYLLKLLHILGSQIHQFRRDINIRIPCSIRTALWSLKL